MTDDRQDAPGLWAVVTERSTDMLLVLRDQDGWWEASVRSDGCFEITRAFNSPIDDDGTMHDDCERLHICDIEDLDARLAELRALAGVHFGGWEGVPHPPVRITRQTATSDADQYVCDVRTVFEHFTGQNLEWPWMPTDTGSTEAREAFERVVELIRLLEQRGSGDAAKYLERLGVLEEVRDSVEWGETVYRVHAGNFRPR